MVDKVVGDIARMFDGLGKEVRASLSPVLQDNIGIVVGDGAGLFDYRALVEDKVFDAFDAQQRRRVRQ